MIDACEFEIGFQFQFKFGFPDTKCSSSFSNELEPKRVRTK